MDAFIIVWLKESAGAVCVLHSDKHFYRGFISCRGCNVVTYKSRAAADKKAQTYRHTEDGVIIAISYSEFDQLSDDFRRDRRAVLARYTTGEELPAFEDAQPDENGVITCRVNSAGSIDVGGRTFVALLSKRPDVYGWENAVLLITYAKDYDNKGKFSGVPVSVIRPGDMENVRPCYLFDMLHGNGSFSAKLCGLIDWETRISWLSAFTEEEKRAAVQIEKHLQELGERASA